MPNYQVQPNDAYRRYMAGYVEAQPSFVLETSTTSPERLRRQGVVSETSTDLPIVRAGSGYQTVAGDHAVVVSEAVTADGIVEKRQEVVDVGLAQPIAFDFGPGLTEDERAMIAEANTALNAAALESALAQAAAYYNPEVIAEPPPFISESDSYNAPGFIESAPPISYATAPLEDLSVGDAYLAPTAAPEAEPEVLYWDGAGYVSGGQMVGNF